MFSFLYQNKVEAGENSSSHFVSSSKESRMDELLKYGHSLAKNIKLQDYIKVRNESGTEDVHYSIFYEDMPDEFKATAVKELKETEEKMMKGKKRLAEFLKREKMERIYDAALLFVLRSCKFDIKKSETKLKKFYTSVEKCFKKIADMDWKTIEMIMEDGCFGYLPYRDKHGRAILYSIAAVNPEIFDKVNEMMPISIAVSIFLLSMSPISSVTGASYIVDHNEIPTQVLYNLPKAVGSNASTWFNLPIRYGRIDVINEHFFSRLLFRIIKPFLSSKFSARMEFHGDNMEQLHQLYPKEILPREFGGKMGSIRQNFFREEALCFIKKIRELYSTKEIEN